MSIDNCQRCDKRLDTDFVEYQPDGSLYCGACEDQNAWNMDDPGETAARVIRAMIKRGESDASV
jgi:hypothetical protein